ncbi:hypothetical protein [Deinococcus yavapaiensis]|uniref:Uncharacterized protein n=1 Tax=Deinococcus yavapaiensis KR-236 TaxID=694435 RepID=A0A318S3N1_9DEIO|nr:hypothetical protein [Deinococcus yavapaiensis]PYE52045.1 hypothetical protein DES52_11391 [Deinococcus yavapaiensis KR-236]
MTNIRPYKLLREPLTIQRHRCFVTRLWSDGRLELTSADGRVTIKHAEELVSAFPDLLDAVQNLVERHTPEQRAHHLIDRLSTVAGRAARANAPKEAWPPNVRLMRRDVAPNVRVDGVTRDGSMFVINDEMLTLAQVAFKFEAHVDAIVEATRSLVHNVTAVRAAFAAQRPRAEPPVSTPTPAPREDARLAQYEREWRKVHDENEDLRRSLREARAEADALQAQLQRAAAFEDEARRATQLEGDLITARQELEALRRGVTHDAAFVALQAELERLQRRVHNPRFWTAAFAETFAESLASMDAVHAPLEGIDASDVLEVFAAWHAEVQEGVELLHTVGFDAALSEHLRRVLIVQWVYLRWLELTADVGEARA